VLHKSGKLNDEQHRIIRQKAAQASDKALALLLINANYVSQQDIITSVRRFTLDIMYDVATWEKEPFLFEEAELPPADRITVPIDLEPVIYDLSQKRVDADRLSKELPNLDFALKFPEAPSEKFKGIQLSVEEWRVVSFINPKNSIRQIAKACNMTDMEIRRVVIGLLNAGLVELVRPAVTEPARASAGMRKPMGVTKDQRPMIEKLINRIKSV
jgi:DNA-binding MarR family transcriptional regulator